MNLLCTELAGKRDYSEQHNSLTSNLLLVDLCICVGEYFSGTKREFKFVKCLVEKTHYIFMHFSHCNLCTCLSFFPFLSDHENIAMSTE